MSQDTFFQTYAPWSNNFPLHFCQYFFPIVWHDIALFWIVREMHSSSVQFSHRLPSCKFCNFIAVFDQRTIT